MPPVKGLIAISSNLLPAVVDYSVRVVLMVEFVEFAVAVSAVLVALVD